MKRANSGFSIFLISALLAVLFFSLVYETRANEVKLRVGLVPMNVKTFLDSNSAEANKLKILPMFLYRSGVATAYFKKILGLSIIAVVDPSLKMDNFDFEFVTIRYKGEELSYNYRSKEKVNLLQQFYDEYFEEEERFLKKIALENKCHMILYWQPLAYHEIIKNGIISLELTAYDVIHNVSQTGFVELDKKLWDGDKGLYLKKIIERFR